jgi:hypothetical protein
MRGLCVLLLPLSSMARADEVSFDRAAEVLPGASACVEGDVRCLIAARYSGGDARAKKLALALFDELGDVPGVEAEHDMEGGFRGTIHIVPELPSARHLEWVLGAQREIERFVVALAKKADRPLAYRHRALVWKFFRSVDRHTPSAYASGWEVGYNVAGSLLRDDDGVRDTLFHEIFHLNDAEHGGWSHRALGELVDGIVAKCGTRSSCLAPYAPMPTQVVATGVYYAFQPDNGEMAGEYAAELATRYFLEQAAALRGARYEGGRFKCRTPENAAAWRALVDEFFGGVDLVPRCAR